MRLTVVFLLSLALLHAPQPAVLPPAMTILADMRRRRPAAAALCAPASTAIPR